MNRKIGYILIIIGLIMIIGPTNLFGLAILKPLPLGLSIEKEIQRGDYATLRITVGNVNPIPGKEIYIYLDGEFLKKVVSGNDYFITVKIPTSNLDTGKHTITVVFNGDDEYTPTQIKITFNVVESNPTQETNEVEAMDLSSLQYLGFGSLVAGLYLVFRRRRA